jgi:hypothetical protein
MGSIMMLEVFKVMGGSRFNDLNYNNVSLYLT